MRAWAGFIQKAGPYLLLEIVMPGGTLLALLLIVYQRKQLTEATAFINHPYAYNTAFVLLFPDKHALIYQKNALGHPFFAPKNHKQILISKLHNSLKNFLCI